MTKPSLHEIAAMPYPASQSAMRQYYNPNWGKPEPDGKPGRWEVSIDYSYSCEDHWSVEVEAVSEEEALELAEAAFDKKFPRDHEIDDIDAEFLGA